ncbi:MAG: hypothetical protein IPM24_13395 [Bryobacterales bacterium]|nr:hypothetical protein [Bryobacterales bacterium]
MVEAGWSRVGLHLACVVPGSGTDPPHVVQADQAGAYEFNAGVPPGDYKLAAAEGITRWHAQDPETVARLAARGTEMRLGPRESRAVNPAVAAIR